MDGRGLSSPAPRVCSTKTRIKTQLWKEKWCHLPLLREYVPLKQGLRPENNLRNTECVSTPRVCSTKTRIKTQKSRRAHPWMYLREYVPLKQGLRLLVHRYSAHQITPRVCSTKTRIKTVHWTHVRLPSSPPRVCSTKTRIKTYVISADNPQQLAPRVCSTKTRIKTSPLTFLIHFSTLREYVPLKQGLRQPSR